MSSPQFSRRVCRPRDHVEAIVRRYPGCWAQLDALRQARGEPGIGDWPDWCFLPLAASYAVVSGGGANRVPLQRAADVGILGALSAWRMTQGIYRFDPAVYDAVWATPVSGDIPHEVLLHLPEWCVYVETPGMQLGGSVLHGSFVHLERDANDGRYELRLLLDAEGGLVPVPLHLGAWPLSESIQRMRAEATRQRPGADLGFSADELQQLVEPIVSLVLYLCSQASEIGTGQRRPVNPEPKKTKRGWKLFQADRPTTWDVGVRMGAALRQAYQSEQVASSGEQHAGPRPHIRRAHWHGYWLGPKDGPRRFDLRWQPPIAVGVDDVGALPAVIRPVK